MTVFEDSNKKKLWHINHSAGSIAVQFIYSYSLGGSTVLTTPWLAHTAHRHTVFDQLYY